MKYNLLVLSVFIRLSITFIIFIGSQGNFDINFTNRLCDDMIKTFFFVVRLIAMIYLFFVIVPDFFHLLRETWQLNSKNWWKENEENFITNCSAFNAIMCWLLYSVFAFLLFFVICFYIPIVIVVNLIALMREPPSTRQAIRY